MMSPKLLFPSLYFSFVGSGIKVSLNCPDLIFKSFLTLSSVQYPSAVMYQIRGVLPLSSSLLSGYRHPCSVLDIIYSFSECLQSTCSVPCMETRLGNLGPGETRSVATWLTAWRGRQAHEQISILWCDRVTLME